VSANLPLHEFPLQLIWWVAVSANHRTHMTWTDRPYMQVGDGVATVLNSPLLVLRHALPVMHVEQNCAGI
jgi:hypothetical protein